MRLKDLDYIDKCYKNFTKEPRTTEEILDFLFFILNEAPTIEAIPVEHVARMLARFTEDEHPCHYGYFSRHCSNMVIQKHRDSDKPCYMSDDNICDCWLNAIKEGWLDE